MLAAPCSLPRRLSPSPALLARNLASYNLMLPSLFSLRLQAAHTGSDCHPKQDWVLSLELKALPQATSVSGSSLKD